MAMKKTFFILALAALVISCAKEIQSETPAEGNKVTVRVSIPEEPLTKVSLTEAADFKSIALAWEASDQISINGEPFTIKEGFSAHEAEFEGTAPTGSTFNIIYPGKYTSLEAASARSYAGQVQTGNGSTAHLEYNAGLIGVSEYAEPKFDPDWAADKGGTLMQNAVMQMRLQLPDAATDATSVTLSASRAIFPTVNYGGSLVKEQTLTLKDVTLPANKILEAYMMVSAAGVEIQDGDELTVMVETSAGIYLRKITLQAQTWTGGGQYTLQLKVQDENIFEINTVDDLLEFRDGVNSGDMLWENVHAILKADLDLSSVSSWTPIGNGTFTPATSGSVKADWTEPAFKGTFDGGGHALKNLKANGTPAENTPYGLFGLLYRATVKNLVLGAETGDTGAFTVTPSGAMDAGVVAGAAYSSTVENITSYLPITLAENTSSARATLGMVGYLFGDVAIAPTILSGLKNYGKITAAKGANANNNAVGFCVAGIGGFSNTAGSIINQVTGCTNY